MKPCIHFRAVYSARCVRVWMLLAPLCGLVLFATPSRLLADKLTARGAAALSVNRTRAGKLTPLHAKMGQPTAGDWLSSHSERGQTFDQYRAANPNRPNRERTTLYIQPIGAFTDVQQQVVADTADVLGRFYGLPVKSLPALALDSIPAKARRVHPEWGDDQLLTTHILNEVLKPKRPRDAVAVLALTALDLWPGEGWNFVFGQANLTERVGVWSLYRNGDPAESTDAYRTCLRRTLKTSTHETGHMLGIAHCTAYACGMNGSNNLEESDRHPLLFCPQCVQKVWWATGVDPSKRYQSLLEFFEKHELVDEAAFCRACLQKLK